MSRVLPEYVVQYAKSNRSKCKKCKESIAQGDLRIGKRERSDRFDGDYHEWRKVECFFSLYEVESSKLTGLGDLKWDDQQFLKSKCADAPGGAADASEQEGGGKGKKRKATTAAPKMSSEEKKAKKEADAMWSVRTKLQKEYKTEQLRAILALTGQSTKGSPDEILSRLVDCNVLGGLPACPEPECADTALTRQGDKIVCEGNISEWSACTYTCLCDAPDAPKRDMKWRMPEDDDIKEQVQKDKLKKAAIKNKEKEEVAAALGKASPSKSGRGLKYDIMSVRELKDELKSRELPLSGTKEELIERLMEGDSDSEEEGEGEDEEESEDEFDKPINKLTIKVLKEELEDRGLATNGVKAVLVKRLEEHVEEAREKRRQEREKKKKSKKEKSEESEDKEKSEDEFDKPINKLTVNVLKEELKNRGLATDGKKAVLVKRLEDHVEEAREKRRKEREKKNSKEKKPVREETRAAARSTTKARVDHGSGYNNNNAEVVTNASGTPFAVTLTKSDLTVGTVGMNSFYKVQMLKITKTNYVVYCKWGRVGEEGNDTNREFPNEEKATLFFVKNFYEKTGNSWSDYDKGEFTKKSGKFFPVETEEGEGGSGDAPLGRLTKDQIELGQKVLERIDAELNGEKRERKLVDMSSEFFSKIPTDFGGEQPVPITTMEMLHAKEELLKFYLRMGFEDMSSDDKQLTPISGVMDLPVPATLWQAAKMVTNKSEVDRSVSMGSKFESAQAGGPIKHMNKQLYAAILLYTSNAIYADLNKCLREENRKKISQYFTYLRLFFEAFDHLPKQKAHLWRGISCCLYDQYEVGKVITWWGVSSCTSDQEVARNFMKSCGGDCTFLTVRAKTACDISNLTFYASEKESLLPPGTQFKVLSSKKVGKVTEIELQEVGRAFD